MTMQSDLSFFALDDDTVILSDRTQSLVVLNATAAFLMRKLQEGTAGSELARALASEYALEPGRGRGLDGIDA